MKSCLVLTKFSTAKLKKLAADLLVEPKGWTIHAHHVTLSFHGDTQGYKVGELVHFKVNSFDYDKNVVAFFVPNLITENQNAHVTFAVAPGAKPVQSLDLTRRIPCDTLELEGIFFAGDDCFENNF